MKIVLVTTPIRPVPNDFPPIGSLSLIHYLRQHGFNVEEDLDFYNIDANRPSYENALDYIVSKKPDILGVSAVVSTAYAYTKQLTKDVKRLLPETLIVVGGNLAASAEILLKRTGTDLCVVGEGEKVFLNIVNRAKETLDPTKFSEIPGIVLLGKDEHLINTGYEKNLRREEIYDIQWTDLSDSTDLGWFIYPMIDNGKIRRHNFRRDPRVREFHRQEKQYAHLSDGKGCIAHCTFCHRWDKGMRYIPVNLYMERLDYLIENHNVGFVSVTNENFGSVRKWVVQFCKEMQKRDVLWSVSAMRTDSVDPELLQLMKDAGCCYVTYGMETGSSRMLKIMQKGLSLEENYNAQKWTAEAGFETVVQLVVGMPGESPDTIAETIEFCRYSLTLNSELDPTNLSINYAQALPGTPLYEFARHEGFLPSDSDGEEQYLLNVSDQEPSVDTAINFTGYPNLIWRSWGPLINLEVYVSFIATFGTNAYIRIISGQSHALTTLEDDGYHANPKKFRKTHLPEKLPSPFRLIRERRFGEVLLYFPLFFYRLKHLLPLIIFLKDIRNHSLLQNLDDLYEYGRYLIFRRPRSPLNIEYQSLREITQDIIPTDTLDEYAVAPLRLGR